MSEPEHSYPEMPQEFHSVEFDGPFEHCSRCGTELSACDHYQINKAYRQDECVFEYAFCSSCRDSLLEEFSEESKANLLRHQEQHLKLDAHGTAACGFCGRTRESLPFTDFTTTALGHADRMLDSLLICFDCQANMQELLSQHTKDVRRRFFEEVPGVPPDWEVWKPDEQQDFKHDSPLNKPAKPIPLSNPVSNLSADTAALRLVVERCRAYMLSLAVLTVPGKGITD